MQRDRLARLAVDGGGPVVVQHSDVLALVEHDTSVMLSADELSDARAGELGVARPICGPIAEPLGGFATLLSCRIVHARFAVELAESDLVERIPRCRCCQSVESRRRIHIRETTTNVAHRGMLNEGPQLRTQGGKRLRVCDGDCQSAFRLRHHREHDVRHVLLVCLVCHSLLPPAKQCPEDHLPFAAQSRFDVLIMTQSEHFVNTVWAKQCDCYEFVMFASLHNCLPQTVATRDPQGATGVRPCPPIADTCGTLRIA